MGAVNRAIKKLKNQRMPTVDESNASQPRKDPKVSMVKPTFDVRINNDGKKTYKVVVSAYIDKWARARKAMLILGLVFCHQAVRGEKIDRAFLEEHNVEPEIIDAALTLVTVVFGESPQS